MLAACTWLFAACGDGGFPDPGPCPTPTPLALRDGATVEEKVFAYRTAVRRGLDRIEELSAGFTARWPDRRLSNKAEFRTDFIAFAQAVRCEAEGLAPLDPPAGLEGLDAMLESAVAELSAIMDDGLAAVRARNVSEFRRWDRRERAFLSEALPGLRGVIVTR